MKNTLEIVLFSALGLFIFGIITLIVIYLFVPADELNNISSEQSVQKPTLTPISIETTTDQGTTKTEFEKMFEKASYSLHALDTIKAYNEDVATADAKYKTKIVRLIGTIRDIKIVSGFHTVLLASGNMPEYILCRIRVGQESSLKDYKKGREVFVVGSVEGKKDHVTLFNCLITPVLK